MKRAIFLLLIGTIGYQVNCQTNTFPYKLRPAKDAILISAGTLLIQGAALGHNQKDPMDESEISSLNAGNINPIDRIAVRYWDPRLNTLREKFEPASAIIAAAGIGSYGLYSKIKSYKWEAMKTLGLMYLEGMCISNGTMLITKALVDRPRPYTYNTSLPLADRNRGANNESFFSGNATLLFFNSVFISQVFSDLFPESRLGPWIWGATLSLSTFSAFLSVRSGMHFPTDVLVGAIVGGFTGYLIPALHKSETQKHLVMMPWVSSSSFGLSLSFAL